MQGDKPFGWRPFTDEERDELRGSGLDDIAIDDMESRNVYAPIPDVIVSCEMASAILLAAAKRFGPDFVHDVRSEMERRAAAAEKSGEVVGAVESRIVRDFINSSDWSAVIQRASDSSSSGGG